MADDAKSQQKIETPNAANGTCRGETSPFRSLAQSMEPRPVPIANTVNSRVKTVNSSGTPCPSAPRTSRTIVGNSISSIAPTTQNQDRPRTESQTGLMDAALRTTRHVSNGRFKPMRSEGAAAGDGGTRAAATSPVTADANPAAATSEAPLSRSEEHTS